MRKHAWVLILVFVGCGGELATVESDAGTSADASIQNDAAVAEVEVGGSCVAGLCTLGAIRCTDTGLETCATSADGCVGWSLEPCVAGSECSEVDRACVPAAAEPRCGDGVINAGEVCDTDEFNGATCAGLGYTGGSMACAADCAQLDDGGCTGLTFGNYAVLSGITGTITTTAFYGGGGAHPGENSIDVGGGGTVWHQLDYLDDAIAGGVVHVYQANSTGCSSPPLGGAGYNGQRLVAETYFFNAARRYLGRHQALYQHVTPNGNVNKWHSWNKDGAAFWSTPNVILNNTEAGGIDIATVFQINESRYVNGVLCTTGTHLHQQAQGRRNPQRVVGEAVTAKYNDLQCFDSLTGGCGGLTYQGECMGDALVWCDADVVKVRDCEALGTTCQYKDDTEGNVCQ